MKKATEDTSFQQGKLLDEHPYKDTIKMAIDLIHKMLAIYGRMKVDIGRKDTVIANLISRAAVSTESMIVLYDLKDFPSVMILLRSLIERVFFLGHLELTKTYIEFEKQTIQERHRQLHRLKSDKDMRNKAGGEFDLAYRISSFMSREIAGSIESRVAPRYRAEEAAKKMKLDFLYRYGYDVASSYVHPMADEGSEDLQRLLGIPGVSLGSEKRTILQNICFTILLLSRNALRFSTIGWDARYFALVDSMMTYTGTGDPESRARAVLLLSSISGLDTQ